MKRQRLAAVTVALLVVGALGAGVASASGPTDHPTGPPATSPSASYRTASYSARCTPAFAGGSIKVQAKVSHPARGKSFTATATATFTSATASINLRRAGRSFVAVGRIPVPSTQATGLVTVTVTISHGGTSSGLTCTSRIHMAGASPTPPPSP